MNSLISPHQSHQKEKTWLSFCVPHRAPVLFHRVFFASLDTPQFFNPHSIIIFPCCYSLTRFRVWFLMGGGVGWWGVSREAGAGCKTKFVVLCQGHWLCTIQIAIGPILLLVRWRNLNTYCAICKQPTIQQIQPLFPLPSPTFIHWDSQNDHKLHPSKGNRFHRCF